jgi:hypothetical protein
LCKPPEAFLAAKTLQGGGFKIIDFLFLFLEPLMVNFGQRFFSEGFKSLAKKAKKRLSLEPKTK